METQLEQFDEEKQLLMRKHLQLVMEANKKVNLTRIDTFKEGLILHVEDSLSALLEMNSAPKGLYGDMGSGAGYPGIPLAIASGRKTVLIDSRQKKMKVVGEIIGELGLEDKVETFAGRAELLARKNPACFAVLTARALSQLSVLLELASPLLEKGGQLICYKAALEDSEMERALGIQRQVGMNLCSDRSFKLCGEYDRRILVFEKTGKSRIKLPRKEGEAQKNPL